MINQHTPAGLHYTVHNNYMINGRPADFVITNSADNRIVAIIEWDGPLHFNQNADYYIPNMYTHMRNALLGQLGVPIALIPYFQFRDITYEKEAALLNSLLKALLQQPPTNYLYGEMRITPFEATAQREQTEKIHLPQTAKPASCLALAPAVSAWKSPIAAPSIPLDLSGQDFPVLSRVESQKLAARKKQGPTTSVSNSLLFFEAARTATAPLKKSEGPQSPWKKIESTQDLPSNHGTDDFPALTKKSNPLP